MCLPKLIVQNKKLDSEKKLKISEMHKNILIEYLYELVGEKV